MFWERALLIASGVLFGLYGLACLFSPSIVAGYTGIRLPDASAATEVAAMYGGLQAGLGVLFAFCGSRSAWVQPGLLVMVVLIGSLALGRTVGLLVHGLSDYNLAALAYESVTALLAVVALRKVTEAPAAT